MADVPENWTEHEHEGKTFWHNEVTKDSTYERPACLVKKEQPAAAQKTWFDTKDPDGYTYYYTADGETTYRRPLELGGNGTAWNVEKDPEGKTFYFNVDTFESVYEKPQEVIDAEKTLGGAPYPGKSSSSMKPSAADAVSSAESSAVAGSTDTITVTIDSGKPIAAAGAPTMTTRELKPSGGSTDTKTDESVGSVYSDEKMGTPFTEPDFHVYFEYFASIDKQKNGVITKASMKEYAVAAAGVHLDDDTLEALVADKDHNGDGKISIREHFLSSGRALPTDETWFIKWAYDWTMSVPRPGLMPKLENLAQAFDSAVSKESMAKFVGEEASFTFDTFKALLPELLRQMPKQLLRAVPWSP